MFEINIVPVKFSNLAVLTKVVTQLKEKLSDHINIIDLNIDIEPAFSPGRSQYYSTKIIAETIPLTQGIEGQILLLTDVDLYIPVLTYIFGEAQLNGKHSIVSVCRLHEEFYSGVSNSELLLNRTMKEVFHELGHNYGLKHCDNWDCVMHSSPGIEEVDIKGEFYCRKCVESSKLKIKN